MGLAVDLHRKTTAMWKGVHLTPAGSGSATEQVYCNFIQMQGGFERYWKDRALAVSSSSRPLSDRTSQRPPTAVAATRASYASGGSKCLNGADRRAQAHSYLAGPQRGAADDIDFHRLQAPWRASRV